MGGVFNMNLLSYTEITCFLKEHCTPDVPPSLPWACNFRVVRDTALPPKRGVTNSQNNWKLERSSFVSDCWPGTFPSAEELRCQWPNGDRRKPITTDKQIKDHSKPVTIVKQIKDRSKPVTLQKQIKDHSKPITIDKQDANT